MAYMPAYDLQQALNKGQRYRSKYGDVSVQYPQYQPPAVVPPPAMIGDFSETTLNDPGTMAQVDSSFNDSAPVGQGRPPSPVMPAVNYAGAMSGIKREPADAYHSWGSADAQTGGSDFREARNSMQRWKDKADERSKNQSERYYSRKADRRYYDSRDPEETRRAHIRGRMIGGPEQVPGAGNMAPSPASGLSSTGMQTGNLKTPGLSAWEPY